MNNDQKTYESRTDRKLSEIQAFIDYSFEIPWWGKVVSVKELSEHLVELKNDRPGFSGSKKNKGNEK